jgi:NRPS condensation-like uncharacterized protein
MYTREASALDLFTDSVRIMGDATLCGVMEFDQRLDPILLESAVRACIMAHPILHSRLVRGNGPAFWEMWPVSLPPLEVTDCTEAYHPQIIGPVDPYQPVQCRVRLLRRSSGDVIVVNLAHAAADGYGLQIFMSQLLQEYDKPGSVLPAHGGIPERDTLWTSKLSGDEKPASAPMKVINPMWPDPLGTSKQRSSFHRKRVSPRLLERIRARAGKSGGSINDVVMAAYFLTMSDLTGHPGPIDIFFPVNLRKHLNDGTRVMSNQAVNVCFALTRRNGDGMEEVLSRVIESTRGLKAGQIGILEQVEMDAACDPEGRRIQAMVDQMVALQKTGLADIFISNPGPFTLPEIEGLEDAYICYPGGYMPCTCFVTSTFRGQMTITMGYQDSERARTTTKKAMDLFMLHLLSLTGPV